MRNALQHTDRYFLRWNKLPCCQKIQGFILYLSIKCMGPRRLYPILSSANGYSGYNSAY